MDIERNTNSVWTGDSLKSYQDKTKSAQDATALAIGSEYNKTTNTIAETTDTVAISEEARKKQQESSDATSKTTSSTQANNTQEASSDGSSTDPKQLILKQIKKVEKQLSEAQNRLAEAMANHKSSKGGNKEKTPEETNGQTDGADAGKIENIENVEDPTVKMIQSEVNLLTTTLATLNGQLLKLEQKGGASGSTGSAGINEGSGLSGGLGERLPIKA